MTWFFRAMAGFIQQPALALLPAALLLALYVSTRKIIVLIAALLWLGYCLYETGMKLRILCTGECNIRVDLIAIYPLLLGLTLVAAIRGLLAMRKNSA